MKSQQEAEGLHEPLRDFQYSSEVRQVQHRRTRKASHAVFASFAPADDPEIAVVVAIPFSYTSPFSSGYIVGTVAKDIYSYYYDIYKSNDGYSYDAQINVD